jgi:hypothetical protein
MQVSRFTAFRVLRHAASEKTANSQQPTEFSRQPTAGSPQPTAKGEKRKSNVESLLSTVGCRLLL